MRKGGRTRTQEQSLEGKGRIHVPVEARLGFGLDTGKCLTMRRVAVPRAGCLGWIWNIRGKPVPAVLAVCWEWESRVPPGTEHLYRSLLVKPFVVFLTCIYVQDNLCTRHSAPAAGWDAGLLGSSALLQPSGPHHV